MTKPLTHPITEGEILAYERDGVVCIRGQFDTTTVESALALCIDHISGSAPNIHKADDPGGGPGRTISSNHMARSNPAFMGLARSSPAAEIAARLMRVPEVRFFYDQLFVKEPGTQSPTEWHHDLPFWPFNGNHIASVWLALTPVTRGNSGMVYVAGSHKYGKMYRPDPAPPRENYVLGEARHFEPCPPFHEEFNNPAFKFLSWDMEPGDCLVHHPMTVHGAGKNASLELRRVALSTRYFGGDATWTAPRTTFSVPGTENGTGVELGKFPDDDDVFPVIWRAHK